MRLMSWPLSQLIALFGSIGERRPGQSSVAQIDETTSKEVVSILKSEILFKKFKLRRREAASALSF